MPKTTQLLWYILILGIIGVGAMLIGVLAARLVKKRLRSSPATDAFTLQDLRDMRRREEITEQEYEAMRATIIAQMTAPPAPEQQEPPVPDADTPPERPQDSDSPTSEDS